MMHGRARSADNSLLRNCVCCNWSDCVVTVGVIFSSEDLAIFSKFKGVTTITFAGRTAILVVSAIGAGVGAQIAIAVRTSSRC